MGRPAGFADAVGLPGSFNSTKRFMKATRACGVMREKASLFRAVRKRPNSACSQNQAAESTAFSATLGPSLLLISLGALAELSLSLDLDSCEKALAAANSMAQLRRMPRLRILDFSE